MIYLELAGVVRHEMEVLLKVGYLSFTIGLGKQPFIPLINLGRKTDIKMMIIRYFKNVHTRRTSLDKHIADHSGGPVMQE